MQSKITHFSGYTTPKKRKLLVDIASETWRRLIAYARHALGEVGGVALLNPTTDGFEIIDPILPPQRASQGSVALDNAVVDEWLRENFPTEADKAMPNVNYVLWHSHGDMSAYFSGTDEKWIKEFVNKGALMSLVINRESEFDIRVDTLVGGDTDETCFQVTVPSEDITLNIYDENTITEEIKAEVADKVIYFEPVKLKAAAKAMIKAAKAEMAGKSYFPPTIQPPVERIPASKPYGPHTLLGNGALAQRLLGEPPSAASAAELIVDGRDCTLDKDGIVTRIATLPITPVHKPRPVKHNRSKRMRKARRVASQAFMVTFRPDGMIDLESGNGTVSLHDTPAVELLVTNRLRITTVEYHHHRMSGVSLHSDGRKIDALPSSVVNATTSPEDLYPRGL